MQHSEVPISGETIALGQFIKLASLVETGGLGKVLIADGLVTVNGEVNTRRGKKLHAGDTVVILDSDTQLPLASATVALPEDDDYFDEAYADDDFDPEKWRNM